MCESKKVDFVHLHVAFHWEKSFINLSTSSFPNLDDWSRNQRHLYMNLSLKHCLWWQSQSVVDLNQLLMYSRAVFLCSTGTAELTYFCLFASYWLNVVVIFAELECCFDNDLYHINFKTSHVIECSVSCCIYTGIKYGETLANMGRLFVYWTEKITKRRFRVVFLPF